MVDDAKPRNDPKEQMLWDLLQNARVAMMTTCEGDGTLHSRPMALVQSEIKGALWFFTESTLAKVDEIRHDAHVNLTFMDPAQNKYVAVSGQALLVRDKEQMRRLWNPGLAVMFPGGLESPTLTLIKVVPRRAEFWTAPSMLSQLVSFAAAFVTGGRAKGGEDVKVEFPSDHAS